MGNFLPDWKWEGLTVRNEQIENIYVNMKTTIISSMYLFQNRAMKKK